MKYTVGTYIVGKGSGDIKTGEKISINKISKTPSEYGTISVFFWKDEYSDRFDPSELDGLQLKKINNSPEYGGGINESFVSLTKILAEGLPIDHPDHKFNPTFKPVPVQKQFYATIMKMLRDKLITVPGLDESDWPAFADTVAVHMFKHPFGTAITKY